MKRSLKKGDTTIEIGYQEDESCCISAIETEVELKKDHAVFRTKLKPVGGNQADDADAVFTETLDYLKTITFRDKQIRETTAKFLKAYQEIIKFIKLEVIYKNKVHLFNIDLKPADDDDLCFELK